MDKKWGSFTWKNGPIAVIGTQWGNEGKSKVVGELAQHAFAIVRFDGGATGSHTLRRGGEESVFRLLPVDVHHPDKLCIVGPHVACDPEILIKEIRIAKECGSRVKIDPDAPVIMPIHRQLDAARQNSHAAVIGDGTGPCYEDLVSRRGPTLKDLCYGRPHFREQLERGNYFREKQAALRLYGGEIPPPTIDETVEWAMQFGNTVYDYLNDTRMTVHELVTDNEPVLFEGAQGVMQCLVDGGNPYGGVGGISTSFGIREFERIIGVAKAYTTRDDQGPFPTELKDSMGEKLRDNGHEFSTITRRPRRCGWLDLPALQYACRMGQINMLVMTKLDVLTGRNFYTCKSYTEYFEGQKRNKIPALTSWTHDLLSLPPERLQPEYQLHDDWEDISTCTNFDDLPPNLQAYLYHIRGLAGQQVFGVSTGPGPGQMVWW